MSDFRAKPHITTRGGQTVVEFRVSNFKAAQSLYPVPRYSSFAGYIPEPFTGAWQRNLDRHDGNSVLRFSAVFRCLTLISGDISKLRPMLMEEQADGTKKEVADGSPFLPVLRKPNHYQTWQQFAEEWSKSKETSGNMYALKERDQRGVVSSLFVLDPCNVEPLVAESGSVFYRLRSDRLAGIDDEDGGVIVPASEIIHDRGICFWHPLIGVSPLYAAAMAALQGLAIQNNSARFFENMSRPSGMLIAPKAISDETAKRLKEAWETNFQGRNIGRLAVLGDGLKYEAMVINPVDAQLAEQLQMSVADVARAFGVPPYKLGLQTNIAYSNASQADQDYYSQCLQVRIFAIQALLREGLELPTKYRVWLNLEDLLLMDPLTRAETNAKRLGSGELSPNEARANANLPPVDGGEDPFMQQQMWPIPKLRNREVPAPGVPALPAPSAAAETRSLIKRLQTSTPSWT